MPITNSTPNRGYQLPADGNDLSFDIDRLLSAFGAIDDDVAAILIALATKAALNSPAFTGTPTAPTATLGDDSSKIANTAFVKNAISALVAAAPGALDTLNELAAALGDDPNFATTMTNALAGKLAKNSNLSDLQDVSVAQTNLGIAAFVKTLLDDANAAAFLTTLGVHATVQALLGSTTLGALQTAMKNIAPRDNLIVNPRMQLSQENGNSAGGASGYYAADQWSTTFVTSAGVLSTQRVQSVTPRKSKDRYRVSVTTADASLAAGEYLFIQQHIEGNRIAHLGFGAAGASQLVLRFGFKGPAGTYAVALNNSAANRSYVATFVVAVANTDAEYTIVIPGDTTGTWLTDTGIGIRLTFALAAGSTFNAAAAGVWAAGQAYNIAGLTNGWGANTNVFELFDVGLYADPDGLGVAPPWVPNSFDFDLFECKRYYQFTDVTFGDVTASVGARYISAVFVPEMRVGPTTVNFLTLETASNVSSLSLTSVSVREGRIGIVPAGSGTVFMHQRFSCNARM